MASITLCTTLVNLIDGIDLGLFPASFKALEHDLKLTPTDLGLLSMMGGLTSCATILVWGCLADNYNRKFLFVISTAALGVITISTGLVTSFWSLALTRIAAGACVSALLPLTQSLLAESVASEGLGVAFGVLASTSHLSGAGAAMLAARLSSWRLAYAVMGFGTLGLSAFIWSSMPDVDAGVTRRSAKDVSFRDWLEAEQQKVRAVFLKRTFLALLAGGIVGCIPWNALSFLMMFFQGMGFSAEQVGNMMAVNGVGKAIGAYMGGCLGDVMAKWSPMHGRAFMAQITIVLGMVALMFPLCLLPWSPDSFPSYCCTLFLFGIVSTWCNPAVDRPLWAELVTSESRGTIVAWWTFIAGSFGAICGGPIVGWMAEHLLGYQPGEGHAAEDTAALSKALVVCTMVPWALCFCAYSMIHVTYSIDVSASKHSKAHTSSKEDVTQLASCKATKAAGGHLYGRVSQVDAAREL